MIIMILIPCRHHDKFDAKGRLGKGKASLVSPNIRTKRVYGCMHEKTCMFEAFLYSIIFLQGNVDECELRVLLHQSLAGCVIGKGGSKIKELKDVSRTFLILIYVEN
jgi:KH domain